MGFGVHVAISGDYAFVSEAISFIGSPVNETRVHVFHRWEGGSDAWGWTQTLVPPDGDDFAFGAAVHAWEDRLAIFRPAHEYNFLGATVCKDRAVFMYELNNSGQWVTDGVIGNNQAIVSSCTYIGRECCIAAEGTTLVVTSHNLTGPSNMKRLEVYRRLADGDWVVENVRPTLTHSVAIAGDTIAHFIGVTSIELFTIYGTEIDTIFPVVEYSGSDPFRTLEISGRTLAIAQPGGQTVDYSAGRILLKRLDQPGFPSIDTISVDGSSYFARYIRYMGSRLVAVEGGDTSAYRVIVYQRIATNSDAWSLSHQFIAADLPRLDLSSEGLMIMSISQPWSPENYFPFEVTIHDLSTAVGVTERVVLSHDLRILSDGSRIHVCSDLEFSSPSGELTIYDVTGRTVATSTAFSACSSGIELSYLPSGIYLVQLVSDGTRISVKLQW